MSSQKKPSTDNSDIISIAENRRARYDYALLDTYECGIVLVGTEVKSLREKRVNFSDAYALVKGGEIFLIGLQIQLYAHGTHTNHEIERTRKLLLHKKEIEKIIRETQKKGHTLVPVKLYFKKGRAKVLIATAVGKTHEDKRDDIKKREADREVSRVLRRG